jgi:ketosteroid isomerase-like protein
MTEQSEHDLDALTDDLTGRFREAFNKRDIATLRSLYTAEATSVIAPGVATTGAERAATLDHFFDQFDTCESSIRHAYVADDIALLVVDWAMTGPDGDGGRTRIEGAATDVVRRGPDGKWRYVIDNPFGSGPFD